MTRPPTTTVDDKGREEPNEMTAIRTTYPAPIAYAYEAAEHCPDCAAVRFGTDDQGFIPETARDREGNPVGAVAPWDEIDPASGLYCDTCGREIVAAEPYTVIANTPGYLPEDDDPARFSDLESAKTYLRDEVKRYCDFIADGDGTPDAQWSDDGESCYVVTTEHEHDLGRVFEIVPTEPI